MSVMARYTGVEVLGTFEGSKVPVKVIVLSGHNKRIS